MKTSKMAEHDEQPDSNERGIDDETGMAMQYTKQSRSGQRTGEPTVSPTSGQKQSKRPSKLKQLWAKLELDVPTVAIMFKGSIAPIIAIAMYQADAVANKFGTVGYLIAIVSILSMPIMPRGKFIQNMVLLIIALCLAAATNILALYCATQARKHTTPSGSPLTGYNSSASAVLAIWLCVQIFFINVLRGSRPQLMFQAIVYSIFTIVSLTYGVMFPTMAYVLAFMQRLLEAFLTGFGLATAVHFLIVPISSRTVVFKEMTGYLKSLSGLLQAQTAYMASLEELNPGEVRRKRAEDSEAAQSNPEKRQDSFHSSPLQTPAALKEKEILRKTIELHTKLHGDLTPAKREFAFGKLESHDLTGLWKLLRMAFVPVFGLSASIDILQRRAVEYDLAHEPVTEKDKAHRHELWKSVHFIMTELHAPFAQMTGNIESAITHVLLTLELVKAPKKAADEESKGDLPTPGSPGFAEHYKKSIDSFYQHKKKTLRDWCQEHGLDLPDDFFERPLINPESSHFHGQEESVREKNQRQLFFALYLEYMLWRAGNAVLEIVLYADRRKQEGALKSSKLIFPGSKTLHKWLRAVIGKEDFSKESSYMQEMDSGSAESVDLGMDFERRKDPEHLPPRNIGEKIGEALRKIPNFFRSDASSFGFRVVCATMSLGIVCYLEASQDFFIRNRLLWAMIMVAISMARAAGQSTFGFVLRIVGTIIAMIGSYIIWYIVDGHTAGVIVLLWFWIFCAFYFVLKFPKMVIVAIISLITAILILGYELQVKKLGVAASTSNGQPAYATYILAPYRLATVCVGMLVAWIWTIFPFPVSESSELRKDLGATLYLLSNFYSVVHETVQSRVKGTDGDANVKGTHANHLEKARNAVFQKLMLLLSNLKSNTAFSKFQLRIGGRFPREEYEELIQACERITQNIALIGYASSTYSMHGRDAEITEWSNDFRKLVAQIGSTSHRITSVLALMSHSVTNGQPLPPYLEMPKPFMLAKSLDSIDPNLLGVQHVAEVEYSAFAVLTICARNVSLDLDVLKKHVENLVGVTDFTFHAISTRKDGSDSSSEDLDSDKDKSD